MATPAHLSAQVPSSGSLSTTKDRQYHNKNLIKFN